MPQRLTTHALEEGTYAVVCAFVDENDNAVAPQSMSWTLSDLAGTIINSRDGIAVANPSSTQNVVLSGDDLAFLNATDKGWRRLLVEITFSSNLGSDLPLKDSAEFQIDNLIKVS
jgi:hypothetical protein